MKRIIGGQLLHRDRHDTAHTALKAPNQSHERTSPQVTAFCYPSWAAPVSPCLSITF